MSITTHPIQKEGAKAATRPERFSGRWSGRGIEGVAGLSSALLLVGFCVAWGLSTEKALGGGLVVLAAAAVFLALKCRGRLRVPGKAMLFLAAALFLLFWVPVWLLPWPEGMVRFLSPFRVGLSEFKAPTPLCFSGQDAVVWLACAWGAAAAFLFGLAVARGRAFRWFSVGLFATGAAVAGVMLFLYAAGVEIDPGVPHAGALRLRGPLPNPDRFACWLGMLMLVGLGVGLSARGLGLLAAGTGVVVLVVGAVLTASRGTFLGLVFLVVFAAVALRKWKGARPLMVPMVTAVAVLFLAGAWGIAGRLLALPEEVHRIEAWKNALPMLRDFAGFGVGAGAFYRVYPWYQPVGFDGLYLHLHNELLEIPLELGMPGWALIAGIVWWLAAAAGRTLSGRIRWREPVTVAVVAAVLLPLFQSTFDFPLRQPANLFLWSALLGVLAGRLRAYGGEDGASVSPRAALPVGVILLLMGTLLLAAGVRASVGDEEDLLAAARFLPPGERFVTQAHQAACERFRRGRMALDEFEAVDQRALAAAGEDAFVLYRSATAAAIRGRPYLADRLMRLAGRGGRGYRGINQAVARYFWERFRISGGQYWVFFRSLEEAIERLPGEELLWVETFLRNGMDESLCRRLVGDTRVPEYARLLLRLDRKRDAELRFREALDEGNREAVPYLAGLWFAAGRREQAFGLWSEALEAGDVPFSAFVETINVFGISDPEFLLPMLEKCRGSVVRLRWLLSRLKGRDKAVSFALASALLRLSARPGDVVLYVRAAVDAGEREAAWRALVSALLGEPGAAVLWRGFLGLAADEPGAGLLFRLAGLDVGKAPPDMVADLAGVLLKKGLPAKAVLIGEHALARGFFSRRLVETLEEAYRSLGFGRCADGLRTLLDAHPSASTMSSEKPAQ